MLAPPLSPNALLVIQAAATWFLVGLIWVIQVVHYPLFARVGAEGFAAYEASHSLRITWVVMPPMLLELALAFALLLPAWRPASVSPSMAWLGVALVVTIWLSTFALQVPQHDILARGFDDRAHRMLVLTNWLRTIAWSLRGGLLAWWISQAMRHG